MLQAKWAIKFNPKSKIGRNKALMQFMITSCIQEPFPAMCIKQALITRPAFFGCGGESVLRATVSVIKSKMGDLESKMGKVTEQKRKAK